MNKDMTKVQIGQIREFMKKAFLAAGVRKDVAGHVIEGLIQTSVRGVDSHGVRLFPHYLKGVKGGRLNPAPAYKFKKTSCSTGVLDADHTFGHAAGMEAADKAVGLAKKAGTGFVAVCNSSHFGAASYYALEIAKHDMIGMSFTNTDALVKTYAGKRPFLGNNPVCFTVPCAGEGPICLDMATSVITFNKVRQLREARKKAPVGVGADENGIDTTDPDKITMLLPVGGYKGYGLSLIVEILCGLLTGMPYGPHIPKMFEAPMSRKRYLGQFIGAIRIDCFQNVKTFKKRVASMVDELRSEPSLQKGVPVQVAGDPEKKIAAERTRSGIPLTAADIEAFRKVRAEFNIKTKGSLCF